MATYLRLLEDALVSFQNSTEILETWPQALGCILLVASARHSCFCQRSVSKPMVCLFAIVALNHLQFKLDHYTT